MTAGTAPATSDRSDFRLIVLSGVKIGLVTAVSVIVYLAVWRMMAAGLARDLVESVVVLVAGTAVSFLPAQWSVARHTEGIAAAAAIGLCGSVTFMVVDIVLLRPFKAYPWTWDALGGGSTWWYLPIWWMLATFVAWQGGMLTAGRAAKGTTSLAGIAAPVLAAAVIVTAIARLSGDRFVLPALAGGSFAVVLTVFAVVAVARKG